MKKNGPGKADKIPTTGEPSHIENEEDSDEMEDKIKEEDDQAYTVEGQKLFQQRAGRRITHFGQYFRTVEYRFRYLESELKKLRGDDSKSKAKDDTEQISTTPTKVISGIRRLNWAEFKPSLKPQETPELGSAETSHRFTWEGLKVRPNLQEKSKPNFTAASSDQHDSTL